MRRIRDPRGTAIYFSIAMTMMIVIKLFVLGDIQYWKDLPLSSGDTRTVVGEQNLYRADILDLPQSMPPEVLMSEGDRDYLNEMRMARLMKSLGDPVVTENKLHQGKVGRIVIIIDDMGMNRRMSHAAMDLPAPVTLAFLPYAPKLPDITKRALARGHELLIHVPMEPLDSRIDPGPLALRYKMDEQDLRLNLSKVFESFDGYAGINNHMGSKLTASPKAMAVVMEELAQRDLLFVDSKTVPHSVAGNMAAARGLRYATRDVFLDHEDTPEFVAAALRKLERIALRRGVAIGIGHPKANTIQALRHWLPSLKDKNLSLVPISDVVRREPLKVGNERIPALQTLPQIEPATY